MSAPRSPPDALHPTPQASALVSGLGTARERGRDRRVVARLEDEAIARNGDLEGYARFNWRAKENPDE